MSPELGSVRDNVQKGLNFAEEAVKQGAKIICFPETFNTGYNIDKLSVRLKHLAEDIDGYTSNLFRQKAKELGVYMIVPIVYRAGGEKPYNSALFINDEGSVQGIYSKNHLFGREAEYFKPGKEYKVFDTKYGKIGIVICYDANFVESHRINALMGAELVFTCAAWRIQEIDIWNLIAKARAVDNQIYTAFVNSYNEFSNLYLFGGSQIVNPRGQIIAESKINGEQLIIGEVDLSVVTEIRNAVPLYKDRRPEMYQMIGTKK